MSLNWNPERYLHFAGYREQPGLDLLHRITLDNPARIADLGCGTGNSTAHLHRRWPQASIVGVDNSAKMLSQARDSRLDVVWRESDIAEWESDGPQDLIYSNAALHWLDDHGELLPRLLAMLRPGGVLAVQMPLTATMPSHQLIFELASSAEWVELLDSEALLQPIAEPAWYYQLLANKTAQVELWMTEYLQILEGDDPVLNWLQGTALLALQRQLDEAEFEAFKGMYADRLRQTYPKQADGKTLFPFRRLFFVATLPNK